jgi:hypothetical protein
VLFNLESVFAVDDYLFAYGDELTDERSEREIAFVAKLLALDSPLVILELAFGFGRHAIKTVYPGHGTLFLVEQFDSREA